MRVVPINILLLTTISYLVPDVLSIPYTLIQNSKPKCTKLEVPHETLLMIAYDIPDFSKQTPVTIKISQTNIVNKKKETASAANKENPNSKPSNYNKPKPITTTLTEGTGKLMHKVESDGTLNICITIKSTSNSKTASYPFKVGLQISSGRDTQHYHQEQMEHHLSYLQEQIMRLIDEMQEILSEADYAKERERVFYGKSVTMHSSAQWWPILHILLLLFTGVIQGLHMIRFFKSKHLV